MATIGRPLSSAIALPSPVVGAAADGDGAVGAEPARLLARLARRLDRHVHRRAREDAGAALAEQLGHALGGGCLLRRGQHERAPRAEPLDLGRQAAQRAGPKTTRGNVRLEVESSC